VSQPRRVFVCMIAYTEYAGDARVRRESETLAANGFHVRCLSLRGQGEPRAVLNGVEVQQLPVRKYRGKSTLAYIGSYLHFLLVASFTSLRLLVRRELDVVHVHNLPDFLVLAGLVPRLAGVKVVLDVHDSLPETFATKFSDTSRLWSLFVLEERLSALLAHKVICVNHPQRDTLVARGISPSKTFISMNIPDPKLFAPPSANDRFLKASENLNLVYHGTMAKRLGIDLVIRASAELQRRVPHPRLHLWGHGDDLAEFRRLARDLQIDEHVFFRPEGVPLHELPSRLRAMDIGVIGNRHTAAGDLMLPVKLLEYIALGIPVVVPRLKTIQHYFADNMLAYYAPDDVQSLADAIYRLYSEPDRRATQASRARTFLDQYGWQRQGPDFVNFYHSVVEH
jgi:glycosyltransferase involved in cell wall biosynthesis